MDDNTDKVNHVKPTAEELEANTQKALEELDTPTQEIVEETTPETPIEEVETVEEEPKVLEPENDINKRYIESTREAQILAKQNQRINDTIEQAAVIEDPSEQELMSEYPDWELLDPAIQKIAKDNLINKKRFELIHSASLEGKDIQKWNDQVDQYIDDPKTFIDTPDLEGKQTDFKVFASKPTRRGLPFEDLVAAFLYDASKKVVQHKGKMFETGNGGPKDMKPSTPNDKISVEASLTLRDTDYKKYIEMLKAGKIANPD